MESIKRVGIIICDRYRTCSGGKCFRALRNREGAFSIYKNCELELAGYTSCGGCPGGNVEYAGEEMKKNGVTTVHLATGFLVGYPPCPNIDHFVRFMEDRYAVQIVIGTHPIPEKYHSIHTRLETWNAPDWFQKLAPTLTNAEMRLAYD